MQNELERLGEPTRGGAGLAADPRGNKALQIDADTIAGPWDGMLVDCGRIVGYLAAADGQA